jgi:hypothetical protein
MIALLVALLSAAFGIVSQPAVNVNQMTPAAIHSQASKPISNPSTGHPLAG